MLLRKKHIIFTGILLLLFVISFFLPVIDFSFGTTLNGFEAFVLQAVSVYSAESYVEYLWKALLLATPILDVVLIFWLLRKQINKYAVIVLGGIVIISAASWMFRYGTLNILRVGYYYWLILNVLIVGIHFIVKKEKPTD